LQTSASWEVLLLVALQTLLLGTIKLGTRCKRAPVGDNEGKPCAVFQPIENGKKLKDLKYIMPVKFIL